MLFKYVENVELSEEEKKNGGGRILERKLARK